MGKEQLTGIFLASFKVIPLSLRRAFFIGLFKLFYLMVSRQRMICLYNLRRAFPDKPDREIKKIAAGVYRNMGTLAAEFFELPWLTKENLDRIIEVKGLENCEKALAKGRGVLIFSAHFGNWELAVAALSLLVKPVVVIYRPLDNPFLDILVARVRSALGNIPLPKENAMRAILRNLKQNKMIGLLIDQNTAWYEGVFVDYFGRPACTTNGLALLALHSGAPVLPAFAIRLEDGRYRLVIGPEVEIINTGDKDADVIANTQLFTKMIEQTVRSHPDQWLWVHQRWKTQPSQVPKGTKRTVM